MGQLTRSRATRFRTIAVGLFAATMALALVSSSAHAAPRSFYGLVPNADLQANDYRLIAEANVGSARVPLFWHVIEGSNDQFNWRSADRMFGEFASRGIQALPLLYGNPSWLSNSPHKPPVGSARQQSEWQQFVGEAVQRYGQGGRYWRIHYPTQFPGAQPKPVRTWQIWNEQNGPKHFRPKPNVKRYSKLLGISKKAIEAEDSSGQVLVGGMASKPTGKGGINAWKFVRKLAKEKSSRRSFDHVALHPYARDDREIVSHVKKMRRALKKGRKKKAQLWITEVGWSSVRAGKSPKLSTTPKGQAKRLKKTFGRLARKRKSWKIGGVYWYTWRDTVGGICNWCPNSGLVSRNLQPKPAYTQYKKIAR